MLGHLGGAIPYLVERLDRGFQAFDECRANIDQPPSEYLKHFYYDTVNFNPRAIELAIAFAGADHILAGSDYPHQIGSIPKMLESIGALDLPELTSRHLGGKRRESWRCNLEIAPKNDPENSILTSARRLTRPAAIRARKILPSNSPKHVPPHRYACRFQKSTPTCINCASRRQVKSARPTMLSRR